MPLLLHSPPPLSADHHLPLSLSTHGMQASGVGLRPEDVAIVLTNAWVKGSSQWLSGVASYKWGMVKAGTSFSLRVNGEIRLGRNHY